MHLAYELHVANYGGADCILAKLEVLAAGTEKPLLSSFDEQGGGQSLKAFKLGNGPTGMALVARTRDGTFAALTRPDELDRVPVIRKQLPEQAAVTSKVGIRRSETDRIAERHDLQMDLLRMRGAIRQAVVRYAGRA
jgi:hypothetical protein